MGNVSFIIAEPSYVIRKGLVAILEEFNQVKITGEVDSLEKLKHLLQFQDPDVIISNSKFLSHIPKNQLKTRKNEDVLLIPLLDPQAMIQHTNEQFLSISEPKSELLQKIRSVIEQKKSTNPFSKKQDELTRREELILKYISLGLTNKEIAEKLFISTHTVITHRKNITKKLGIKTVSGLTIYAILNRIIEIEDLQT